MSKPFQRQVDKRRIKDVFTVSLLRGLTYLLLLAGGLIFANLIWKGAPVLFDRGIGFIVEPTVPTAMHHFTDAVGEERMLDDPNKRIYDWLIEDEEFQQAFLQSEASENPRELLENYPSVSRKLGGLTLSRSAVESGVSGAASAATALADQLADSDLEGINPAAIEKLRAASERFSAVDEAPLSERWEVVQEGADSFAETVAGFEDLLGTIPDEIESARDSALPYADDARALANDIVVAEGGTVFGDNNFSERANEITAELEPLSSVENPIDADLLDAYAEARLAAASLVDLKENFDYDKAIDRRLDQIKAVEDLLEMPKMREAVEAAIVGEGEAEVGLKSTPFAAGSLLGPIIGTVLLVSVCVVVALILGVAAAIYLSEYAEESPAPPSWLQIALVTLVVALIGYWLIGLFAPNLAWNDPERLAIGGGITLVLFLIMPLVLRHWVHLVRLAIINLAGVPSIVFGIFGFALFVIAFPMIAWDDPSPEDTWFGFIPINYGWGTSVMAGGVTLAFMILPVVIVASEEALRAVPRGFREASLALGASKWETIRKAVLPYAAPGILTSSVLAITRVAGETAPIMFTAAVISRDVLPWQDDGNWLMQSVMALPYHVYTLAQKLPETQAAEEAQYGSVLVFVMLVFLLALASVLLRWRLRSKLKW